MSTTISNSVQNLSVEQKEFEQPNEEVVESINSESKKSSVEQVHKIDPGSIGSIVDLLA